MGRNLSDKWKHSPVIPIEKTNNLFDYDKVKDTIKQFVSENNQKIKSKK